MEGDSQDHPAAPSIIDMEADMDYILVHRRLHQFLVKLKTSHGSIINDGCPLSGGTSLPSIPLKYESRSNGVHKS